MIIQDSNATLPTVSIPASLNPIKNEKVLLPKTAVNPKNVLTHVIGGLVFKEGDEPFPITRQRYSEDSRKLFPVNCFFGLRFLSLISIIFRYKTGDDEPPAKRRSTDSPEKTTTQSDRLSCTQCGKPADKKLKYKPFCSKSCSKAAKLNGTAASEHKLRHKGENGTAKGGQSPESLPSPTSSSVSTNGTIGTNGSASHESKKSTVEPMIIDTATADAAASNDVDMDGDEANSYIVKWSVDEVCEYVRGLAGYSDYAEDFANHEIDGQALVLLNENHLVNTMNIKLGPALKIMSQIETLKRKSMEQQQQ